MVSVFLQNRSDLMAKKYCPVCFQYELPELIYDKVLDKIKEKCGYCGYVMRLIKRRKK